MKYKKKPVVIEAWLWDETKATLDLTGLCFGNSLSSTEGHSDYPEMVKSLRIISLEGVMKVNKGDYIIKGVKGEFYPCKPDIFEMTYEQA